MSFEQLAWARRIDTGSPTRKSVLMALASYSDERWMCWPSQRTLSLDTEFSVRAVRKALCELEELNIIDRRGRRDREQNYMTDIIRLNPKNWPMQTRRIDPEDREDGLSDAVDASGTSCRSDFAAASDDRDSGTSRQSQRYVTTGPAASDDTGSGTSRQSQRHQVPPNYQIELPAEEPERTTSVNASTGDWPKDAFEQFWTRFPNKVGKPAARKSFDRIAKTGKVPWATLMKGLMAYVRKDDDRQWCNPTTFLNQERWEDQPAQVKRQGYTKPGAAI